MRMNNETKLVFALEHIAHLHDLIEGNYWEDYLRNNLDSLECVLESQLDEEIFRKQKRH
mgnify:CR=1 FL=1|tara:strand:- start:306 stop:482 length:177 start_codon:yes stop_codon:yes gene_type:complete